MRARFVNEMAVNTFDKYYAPPELVNYVVDKTMRVVGEDNVTEIVEPSAGDGAFIEKLDSLGKPVRYFDLKPEHPRIKTQDFYKLDLPYEPGRLFIGGPPYGPGSKLWLAFVRGAAKMGDYIAYISPPSYHDVNPYPQFLEVLHTEQLPMHTFLGSKTEGGKDVQMRSSFNIYRVVREGRELELDPRDEQLKRDFDIGTFDLRMHDPSYRKSPAPEYEYYLTSWGWDLGNWSREPRKSNSIGITVKNEELRDKLEEFLDGFKERFYRWFESRSTGSPRVQVDLFKRLLKDYIY